MFLSAIFSTFLIMYCTEANEMEVAPVEISVSVLIFLLA
jgi:hypothetical protein